MEHRLAERIDNGLINAMDPNLEAFVGRGGKILMYHGWSDQLIPPRHSINYYSSVVASTLPLPAGGEIQGNRKRRRSGQLRLQGSLMLSISGPIKRCTYSREAGTASGDRWC